MKESVGRLGPTELQPTFRRLSIENEKKENRNKTRKKCGIFGAK